MILCALQVIKAEAQHSLKIENAGIYNIGLDQTSQFESTRTNHIDSTKYEKRFSIGLGIWGGASHYINTTANFTANAALGKDFGALIQADIKLGKRITLETGVRYGEKSLFASYATKNNSIYGNVYVEFDYYQFPLILTYKFTNKLNKNILDIGVGIAYAFYNNNYNYGYIPFSFLSPRLSSYPYNYVSVFYTQSTHTSLISRISKNFRINRVYSIRTFVEIDTQTDKGTVIKNFDWPDRRNENNLYFRNTNTRAGIMFIL
jgi:hypothetical protein